MTPSAIRPTSAACAAVPMPKPTATGISESALVAATSSASAARDLGPLAGRPHGRDHVDETAGDSADPGAALGRRRRRHQRHQRQPRRGKVLAHVLGLPERQIRDDRPGGTGGDRKPRELRRPAMGEHHVRVGHQHHRNPVGNRPTDLQRRRQGRPRLQRRRRGRVNRRPIRQRIGERHPQLDQIRPESTYAAATASEVSRSGNPAIMYGINAARPSSFAA